jgi:hypothetical protein
MSKQITELNNHLTKLLSKKQIFARGVIRGVGFAIGTTIIATIVIAILTLFLRPVLSESQINNLFNQSQKQ